MFGLSSELLLLIATLIIAVLVTRRSGASPLMIAAWLWVGIAATLVINPAGLVQVSLTTVVVVVVGLASTVLPLWFRRSVPPAAEDTGAVPVSRLWISALLVGAICGASALAFRAHVAGIAGTDFSALTPVEVRAIQVGAGRSNVGLLGLGSALYPLLACIGIYGGIRHSKLWYLLVVLAFIASLQTPARLMTLVLLVSAAAFYIYLRPASKRPRRRRRARNIRGVVFGSLVVIGGLSFFNALGSSLGKNQFNSTYYPQYHGPAWLLSPILYFTGGIPALDVCISTGLQPIEHGNSVFTVYRMASVINGSIHVPDTLGRFVPIPGPFNVFTGYGQVWLDWGWGGLVVLSIVLGVLSATSHSRADVGRSRWAWVSAICLSLLLSNPQAYRLFFLDTVTQLIVGFLVFRWLDSVAPVSRIRTEVAIMTARSDGSALAGDGYRGSRGRMHRVALTSAVGHKPRRLPRFHATSVQAQDDRSLDEIQRRRTDCDALGSRHYGERNVEQ